jgi:hypothetical protein
VKEVFPVFDQIGEFPVHVGIDAVSVRKDIVPRFVDVLFDKGLPVDKSQSNEIADAVGKLQKLGPRTACLHNPGKVAGFRLANAVGFPDLISMTRSYTARPS